MSPCPIQPGWRNISYIPTDEGWLDLAAVKDLAMREIVHWSMSERLKSTLSRMR